MTYDESLKLVSNYVVSFYTKNMDTRLSYHNHSHTWEVTDIIAKIASHSKLNERDRFIVLTAGWFFDTGYFVPGPDSYENKSAGLAIDFFKSTGVDEDDINEIKKCITVTPIPEEPQTKTQEIVCDAICYYMGTKGYPDKNRLLRNETEALTGAKIPGKEWRARSIALLEAHHYFTDYCQMNLDKRKIENLNRLKRKQEEKEKEASMEITAGDTQNTQYSDDINDNGEKAIVVSMSNQAGDETTGGKDEKGKIKKEDKTVRGLEAVFRVSSTNHQRLSSMADNKAHIMISVNSIIISVVLGLIVRKMDSYQQIIIPTVILLFVNVITITFSVLATRPRLPNGYFTQEQIRNKDIDLTFFGNFYKMKFKDYEDGMNVMMHDSSFLHGAMIRNLYGQGTVLGRKFHLLRISYSVFMYGISISVLAYVVTLLMNR